MSPEPARLTLSRNKRIGEVIIRITREANNRFRRVGQRHRHRTHVRLPVTISAASRAELLQQGDLTFDQCYSPGMRLAQLIGRENKNDNA